MLAVATLALAGCGRKGPLDLPPTAAANAAGDPIEAEQSAAARSGSIFNPPAEGLPDTPKGRKRSFVLDPLLGD